MPGGYSYLAYRLFIDDPDITGNFQVPHLLIWAWACEVGRMRKGWNSIASWGLTAREQNGANMIAAAVQRGDYDETDLLAWFLLTSDGIISVDEFDTLTGLKPTP